MPANLSKSSYGSGYSPIGSHGGGIVSPAAAQQLMVIKFMLYGLFVASLLSVLTLRLIRSWRERFDQIEIRYPEGQNSSRSPRL